MPMAESIKGQSNSSTTVGQALYEATPLRWYILVVHALVGVCQRLVFCTWGPIATSAEESFGLTQSDFGLLPNWFNIGYFVMVFPFMWLLQNKGLRSSELLAAVLVTAGASIRCLNFGPYPQQYRYIIHLGQAINGLASPLHLMGPTYLSAMWFPPQERTLATSLAWGASGLGNALGYVIGPMFVHYFAPIGSTNEETYIAIRKLLYLEALLSQMTLVVVIIYFPSKPKVPPSFTAGAKRTPFCRGLLELLANARTWPLLIVNALASAVFVSWQQILIIFASPVMGEIEAGWLGFAIQITNQLSGPLLTAISMRWTKSYSKHICVAVMSIGVASLGIMTFIALLFPKLFSSTLLWITMVCTGMTVTATQPIWWEMSCEAAYPVGESVVSGVFTLASCSISWIYFFLFMFPQFGTDWATWSFFGGELICIPILLLHKPSNKRSEYDERTFHYETANLNEN